MIAVTNTSKKKQQCRNESGFFPLVPCVCVTSNFCVNAWLHNIHSVNRCFSQHRISYDSVCVTKRAKEREGDEKVEAAEGKTKRRKIKGM